MDNDLQCEAHRIGEGRGEPGGHRGPPPKSGRSESRIPHLAKEQKEEPAALLRGESRDVRSQVCVVRASQ